MRRPGVGLCFAAVLLALVGCDDGRWTASCGRLLSAVCCLAGLYFTMACGEGGWRGGDSFEHILVRKQIHAMNWRFVSNKAVALLLLRQALRDKRPRTGRKDKPQIRRSESNDACIQSTGGVVEEAGVGGQRLRPHLRARSI